MILQNYRYKSDRVIQPSGEINVVMGMRAEVVIRRHGKIYAIPFAQAREVPEKDFNYRVEWDFIDDCEKYITRIDASYQVEEGETKWLIGKIDAP